MSSDIYKPLEIDFPISDNLQTAIDAFLQYINNGNTSVEDCYRSEIDFYLKENKATLNDEEYYLLKNYYVHGGIYKKRGKL